MWTLEPGRVFCFDGEPMWAMATPKSDRGLSPAELDALAHRVVALLNSAAGMSRRGTRTP